MGDWDVFITEGSVLNALIQTKLPETQGHHFPRKILIYNVLNLTRHVKSEKNCNSRSIGDILKRLVCLR